MCVCVYVCAYVCIMYACMYVVFAYALAACMYVNVRSKAYMYVGAMHVVRMDISIIA